MNSATKKKPDQTPYDLSILHRGTTAGRIIETDPSIPQNYWLIV